MTPLAILTALSLLSSGLRRRQDEQGQALTRALEPYGYTTWEEAVADGVLLGLGLSGIKDALQARLGASSSFRVGEATGTPSMLPEKTLRWLTDQQGQLELLESQIETALKAGDVEAAEEAEVLYAEINEGLLAASSEIALGDPQVERADGVVLNSAEQALWRRYVTWTSGQSPWSSAAWGYTGPEIDPSEEGFYLEMQRAQIAQLALELGDEAVPLRPTVTVRWEVKSNTTGQLHPQEYTESGWKGFTADLSKEAVFLLLEEAFGKRYAHRQMLREPFEVAQSVWDPGSRRWVSPVPGRSLKTAAALRELSRIRFNRLPTGLQRALWNHASAVGFLV